jgi:hypothetical protein
MSLLPASSERGSALIGVLLLLMVMTALTAAFAVSGQTETLVVRNHQTAAQARAAAEAGVNHAAEVVLPWILNWKINYPAAATIDPVLDTLLANAEGLNPADPDFFTGLTLGEGVGTLVCPTCDSSYDIFIFDEDSPERVGSTTVNGVETNGGEDDSNRVIVIQAVGYGPNGATSRVETLISPYKLPAIATDGDIDLGLSGTILVGTNSNGGVHANGDVNVTGGLAVVGLPLSKGSVSASGDLDTAATVATGAVTEHAALQDIPDIDATEFEGWADRILTSAGSITNAAGAVLATCTAPGNPCQLGYGLKYSGGTWTITTTAAQNHTYYVEGNMIVSPVGTTAITPMAVTIIAEGSIEGTQGYIKPMSGDLLMVAGTDLILSGNFSAGVAPITNALTGLVTYGEGQVLVGEQVAINGSAAIHGQLVIGEETSTAVPHTSSISGAVVIANDYDVGSSMFRIAGWREVR